MSRRPNLPFPTEEMQRIAAMLAQELASWPHVSTKPMFGLRAYFRKAKIFAMLPEKRSFEVPNGIAFKENGKWKVFEVAYESGVTAAMAVLEKAYGKAT
jgi:hypothetical protein